MSSENKVHLVIPDQHAHPDFHNERAFLLGHLINRLRPDVVVNLGDAADMPSLSSYDRGTRGYEGRRYHKDIESGVDFQDKMWSVVKKSKKKLPRRVILIGNHEQRIHKATQISPELYGTISISDLQYENYYDEVVPYNGATPGVITIDGVDYAHYFISGVAGRSISGEHPATALLTKRFTSSTSGHLHLADYAIRTAGETRKIMGCFAGVFQDFRADFAGLANDLWWSGVVIKTFIREGEYDIEFISLHTLRNIFRNESN